ncbi:MAG: SprT family zinc-dependent metalloprotease [Pseudomonadota bacterium]
MFSSKPDFAYELIRANRRSLSLQVRNGQVIVRAPKRMRLGTIYEFLHKHHDWVEAQLANFAKRPPNPQGKEGDQVWFLGQAYRLAYDKGIRDCRLAGNIMFVGGHALRYQTPQSYKRRLRIWYRHTALAHLQERTAHFAATMGVCPRSVVIRDYKARWGACSSDNAITYNWRIILMPEYVIDYLVVHELAHIIQHNHSPAFWAEVAKILPNFRESRNFLKKQAENYIF